MILTSTDGQRFLGLDLGQWPNQWRAAGDLLFELPLLRALVPQAQIELHHADGHVTSWQLARGQASAARHTPPSDPSYAIELPQSRVLERRLTLPPLAPAELAQAVGLDVASASPFEPDHTECGYRWQRRDDGLIEVDIAITSRQQVEQTLRDAGFSAESAPEVWVLPADGRGDTLQPIVLRGFGEGARERRVRQGLLKRVLLLVLALTLLAALVVTPTALVRGRAAQAAQSFGALQKHAAPQLAQREALMQRLEHLKVITEGMQQQLAMPPVLDMLTRSVPDGAWLTGLRVEGAKLVLNGQADDAAALVQRLAAQPGVHDVRLASPATRSAGTVKESFIIELRLDANRYGPVLRAEGNAS